MLARRKGVARHKIKAVAAGVKRRGQPEGITRS